MLGGAAVRIGTENSLLRTYAAHYDSRLPDSLRETHAREVCRLHERRCATVLAHWTHDAPESPALRDTLAWAQQDEGLREEFESGKLALLAELFDADNFQNAPDTYASARGITKLFTDYYEHSAPFDIDVLSDAWWRCTGDDRCESVGSRYRKMGAFRSASAKRTSP
jgi:hypothetical protein